MRWELEHFQTLVPLRGTRGNVLILIMMSVPSSHSSSHSYYSVYYHSCSISFRHTCRDMNYSPYLSQHHLMDFHYEYGNNWNSQFNLMMKNRLLYHFDGLEHLVFLHQSSYLDIQLVFFWWFCKINESFLMFFLEKWRFGGDFMKIWTWWMDFW